MTDQKKKQEASISPQPDAENKKGRAPEKSTSQQGELSEEELNKVSGGYVRKSGGDPLD